MQAGHWIMSYPKSVLTDSASLRQAVFYFDGVASLLTSPLSEFPCPEEMRMLVDEELFRPVYPQDLVHSPKHQSLATSLWNEYLEAITSRYFTPPSDGGRVSYWSLYPTDMRREWMLQLSNSGITTLPEESEDCTAIPAPYALLYLSLLAKYSARISNYHLTPYTDHSGYHRVSYLRPECATSFMGMEVLLGQILPIPKATVPFQKILKFKRTRPEELLRLRRVCSSLAANLGQVKDHEALLDTIEQSRTELMLSLRELERALDNSRIQYVLSSLKSLINLESPAFLTGLAAVMDEYYDITSGMVAIPLAAKVAGVIGVASIQIAGQLQQFRSDSQTVKQESGLTYLYQARKQGIIS